MNEFKSISGKIERDNDWQEGMNAFRRWTTAEIEILVNRQHDMAVFFERFKAMFEYFEAWQKRQVRKEQKTKGEIL